MFLVPVVAAGKFQRVHVIWIDPSVTVISSEYHLERLPAWLTEQLRTFFQTMPLGGEFAKRGPDIGPSAAIGPSPPLSAPILQMSVPEGAVIPSSLIMTLDAAFLFHLLARDPQKVVAPGKSLLSVLAGIKQAVTHPPESTFEESVGKTMHQAFWDEVNIRLRVLLSSCLYCSTLPGSRSAFFPATILANWSSQGSLQRPSRCPGAFVPIQTPSSGHFLPSSSTHILSAHLCHHTSTRCSLGTAATLCSRS